MTPDVPSAVLWDMDGTIVDTESYFAESARAIFAESGIPWSEEVESALIGATLPHMAATLIEAGVDLPVDTIVARFVVDVGRRLDENVPWKPGAAELLENVRESGIPTALVTMSYRVLAEQVVEAILFKAFDVIVTAEDVEHGKPAPDAYLLAAMLLNVEIQDCIAIEDSPPGVAAAVMSGARVIAVPVDEGKLPPDPRYVHWPSLVGRTVADLIAVQREMQPPVV